MRPATSASTVGLAYSQDPDGTTAQSTSVADLVEHDDAVPAAAADIASHPDAPEPSKPFLLVGSALTAIFIAGMIALTIAVAVNVRPTADQGSTPCRCIPALRRRLPRCTVRRPPRPSRRRHTHHGDDHR
jgi:hypothetical protein